MVSDKPKTENKPFLVKGMKAGCRKKKEIEDLHNELPSYKDTELPIQLCIGKERNTKNKNVYTCSCHDLEGQTTICNRYFFVPLNFRDAVSDALHDLERAKDRASEL